MSAIFKREFKSYFCSVTGAIFIAYILLWFGIYTAANNLTGGYALFENTIANACFISLLAVPVLTMRSFSEELHSGSDKLLYSLPVSTSGIVLAKYFAMVCVFLIPTAVIAVYPFILSIFGTVYFSTAYATLAGYFFIGCVLLSIGMFISSCTESQVISAILSLGSIIFILYVSSIANILPKTEIFNLIALMVIAGILSVVVYRLLKNAVATWTVFAVLEIGIIVLYIVKKSFFATAVSDALGYLDIFSKINTLYYGVFDLTTIVYFLSIIGFFLFLTHLSVEKRRWN